MTTARKLVEFATKQLGVCENPPGSNNVRYNTWFYGREVSGKEYPWCMVFVQWVFDQMGANLPVRTASCGALMRAAQAAGCWVTRDFQPGDVVIYDFPGGADTDHCGVVEMELKGYGVQAIEGNTSNAGSQSNGGMVCRKKRPYGQIAGAVRLKFLEDLENMGRDELKKLIREVMEEENPLYKDLENVPDYWKAQAAALLAAGAVNGGTPAEECETDINLRRETLKAVIIAVAYQKAREQTE